MPELDLGKIRTRIDSIDKELVKLLEERMEIVEDVIRYKKANNMKIFDSKREEEVIKKNTDRVKDQALKKYIEKMLNDIMSVSKEYQESKIFEIKDNDFKTDFTDKVMGYTGVPGSFGHEVLINLIGETHSKIKNYNTHEEVAEAVAKGEIDYGVIPIENSSTGEVRDSIDLIKEKDIYIVGEISHKIKQNLLGIKGSSAENIKNVYSHEQALMQCSKFLKKHPGWNTVACSNTAIAAEFIKNENNKENACIANIKTKDLYDLELLAEGINNNQENYTRFVIISRNMEISEKSNKISIVTAIEHKAGSLFKLIEIFSKENLNMVSIKSRPIPYKAWEYYFYIDFEGNLKDENVIRAFENIKTQMSYMKILGNYRSDIKI
jgi:chorismate mutase/prephenate dehydratase